MFTCIQKCYACISDKFYSKETVGSIYTNPDPLMKRKRKFKRFNKGLSLEKVSWVDPCSREYFKADSEGERVNKEETDILRILLIKAGAKESEVNSLSLSELAENYELYIKAQKKSVKVKAKKSKIINIPKPSKAETPSVSDDAERQELIAKLKEYGKSPHPMTGIEKLKKMLEEVIKGIE
jgi:hypothetical protein